MRSFSCQHRDAALEHRLLVLGVVVLGVLGDVAELPRLLDAFGDLAALLGGQQLEFVLELLQAFRGEDDVLRHVTLDRGLAVRQRTGKSPPARRGMPWPGGLQRRSSIAGPGRPAAALTQPARAASGSGRAGPWRPPASQPPAATPAAAWRCGHPAPAAPGTRGRTCAGSAWRAPRRGARRRAPIVQSSSARTSSRVGSCSSPPKSWANSQGLPSAPRASITAAAPVRANASRTLRGVVQPAGQDHRRRQRLDQARRQLVVGRRPCAGPTPSGDETRSRPRPPRRRGDAPAQSRCPRRDAAPSAA